MGLRKAIAVVGAVGLALLGSCRLAFARAEYQYQFYSVYETKTRSNIWKASCKLCHTDRRGGPLNPYGRALRKAGHYEKYEYQGYRAIEGLDSDGDHWTNGNEIAHDKLPGDAASHPQKPKKPKEHRKKSEKAKKKPKAESKGEQSESPKSEGKDDKGKKPKGEEPESGGDQPKGTDKQPENESKPPQGKGEPPNGSTEDRSEGG
jgi:hypothetical protein